MNIGNKGYVISKGQGHPTIQEVTIIDEKESVGRFGEKIPYLKVRQESSCGVFGVRESDLYETFEDAERVMIQNKIDDFNYFTEKVIPTKEDLLVYLFINSAWELNSDEQIEYLAKMIKEYTGIDVIESIETEII